MILSTYEYLVRTHKPKLLICSNCKGRDFNVVTVPHLNKPFVVQFRCKACSKANPYKVKHGFVSR